MSPELHVFHRRLLDLAQQQPQAIALQGEQQKLNYEQLASEIELRQQLLHDTGARVVAVALDNGPDALLWDLAALFQGLACVPVPAFFSTAQRRHCLEQSQAEVVIAPAEHCAELQGAGYRLRGEFWWRDAPGIAHLPAATAKLTFTSGTTGTPKGVCLSADSILKVAGSLHQASQSQQPQRYLSLLPLAVLLENIGCYAALYAGATLELPSQHMLGIQGASGVDVPRLMAALAQLRPDSMILVPQLLQVMVTACETGRFDPRSLRFVAVGGAKVSQTLLHRAHAAGIPVFEGYGLSECASVVALNCPAHRRPGSVGKPLPHVQVRLAEDGEILVAGTTLLGYLGDDSPVPEWWPTGDLGAFDDEGYLYLNGRRKHQFVTSFGRNVNPEWVEAELTQSGVIGQALVYGEAMAHNHALLWPLRPDTTEQQLAQAVAQANLVLPDYARVHGWTRLEQPFTAQNGLATANGRPRRDVILALHRQHFTGHTAETL
jgi:long-subunit acyl-CoA synthetase (AMP-forming)